MLLKQIQQISHYEIIPQHMQILPKSENVTSSRESSYDQSVYEN